MRNCLWLFSLLLMSSGCTGILWQNSDWDCKPANNPNLRVFNAARQKDLLVVYNEFSERNKTIHTRAYLLNKNQSRVALRKRPHFVSTKLARGLPPVLIFQSPQISTNHSQSLYIVAATNTASFTIYTNQIAVKSCDLPWYRDRVGQFERFIFSPVAITTDAILVGAVIYFGVLGGPCP